jgi:hypothetical protein
MTHVESDHGKGKRIRENADRLRRSPSCLLMRNRTFLSWLGQMLIGSALVIAGLETAWIFRTGLLGIAIGGFAAALLGLIVLGHAEMRERPRRVVRRAQRAFELPPRWGVEFNKAVPGATSAPIVATRTDSTRFVIDVKGYKEAAVKRELAGKDQGQLVGASGKCFHPDPLPSLARLAQGLGATPVLWLPEATVNRNLRLPGSNVIVVMGGARHLKHALLGAEVDSPRHAPPVLPSLPERRKQPRRPRPAAEAKPRQELASSEAR